MLVGMEVPSLLGKRDGDVEVVGDDVMVEVVDGGVDGGVEKEVEVGKRGVPLLRTSSGQFTVEVRDGRGVVSSPRFVKRQKGLGAVRSVTPPTPLPFGPRSGGEEEVGGDLFAQLMAKVREQKKRIAEADLMLMAVAEL